MKRATLFIAFAMIVSQVYSAPQFITFKDGKLGVNFGGYHAGVGIGGLLGDGTAGGLYAEAGTPLGQHAKAGLGGVVDKDGNTSGGLYAGATAGGNVRASAGLAGGVEGGKSAGSGYAAAQAGDRFASSGLGGEAGVEGASGFKFSGTKSLGGKTTVIEQTDVVPIEIKPIVHKKVHKEFKFNTVNEVAPPPQEVQGNAGVQADVNIRTNTHPVVVKEVVEPSPIVYEKHIVRYKPHRHHLRKHAYVGGYLGAETHPEQAIVYKTVAAPAVQKRIDVDVESAASAGGQAHGGGEVTYKKQVTWERNPNFFADIFNIPIQTLKAVSNLVGNTAGSISVQKSATVQADSDISPKHGHGSSVASSDASISVNTSAGKIFDDIFAIPINTLGAVNKFLENNVPARKRVVLDEHGEATRLRGPHARRRANHEVVVVREPEQHQE
ncbi:uncharacterized protein LOC105389318 [Plutella xylostella]|uniref:uncharacterized protein LOC105389318 n=1 Tax=Plutella xylostella TaxID=51655 RepID=UPI002032C4D6|nr:uncharacterized protein LOC105389318 [Plutella xylostella]